MKTVRAISPGVGDGVQGVLEQFGAAQLAGVDGFTRQ